MNFGISDAKINLTDGRTLKMDEGFLSVSEISEGDCKGYAYFVTLSPSEPMADECLVLRPCISDTCKFTAIENHSPYWCRPCWGTSLKDLPARVQEILIEENGEYYAVLPVCDTHAKTLIRGGKDGLEIYMTTNKEGLSELPRQLAFVVMHGESGHEVLSAAASAASRLLGNGLKLRSERAYPEVLEYLGWCSWDAFQIRVDHKGLLEKAKEFKEKDVPVRFAIIDDMWADAPALAEIPSTVTFHEMVKGMHASKLRSFEGDPNRFPQGMKKAVSDLKEAGIKDVGIWFPTTGYWMGLEEGGAAHKELEGTVALANDGRITVIPEPDTAARYFDILCGKTKLWGADFVKIDNQGFHQNFKNITTFGQSASAVQKGIDKAAEKHFGGALINCMGMPSECLFHRTESAVCRCSDDFQPESREWFAKNILQCSYNGLLQGKYHTNDWDMWWTDDEQAKKNSLCRAISGGPIYVSDKLGRTNAEVLKPLCLSDGRILRPDESACPTEDCLIGDPTKKEKIFKICNRIGANGVLAVFNINCEGKPCKGTVSAEDCGLTSGRYAYYEYFSRSGGVLEKGQNIPFELTRNDDFALFTFVPLSNDGVAVFGRSDLFMGVKAARREANRILLDEGGEIAVLGEEEMTFANEKGEILESRRCGKINFVCAEGVQTVIMIK